MFLPCFHTLQSHEHSFDVPNDIFKLCDFNVDLGDEDNVLNMLSGKVENFESLDNFSGYDTALGSYYIYLVDKPRKIMWNTFFDFSFDFSMVSTLLKRAPTFFVLILCTLSYCEAWKSYAKEFDKLRTLAESVLHRRVLKQ